MKLAGSILLSVVIACSLVSPANAAVSGSYKCLGRFDGAFYVFEVVHHNPNLSVQNIKRIRAYDSEGTLYFDTGTVTFPVDPRGSFTFFSSVLGAPPVGDDISVIVNWAQGADVAAPITRANHYFVNSGGDVSMSHASCP